MKNGRMVLVGRALTALVLPPFLIGAFMMAAKNPRPPGSRRDWKRRCSWASGT